jgi:hypothetical protein
MFIQEITMQQSCVKNIFYVHTSKAGKKLKVILLYLWRINVKTTGGFICISFGDFHIDKVNMVLYLKSCASMDADIFTYSKL